MRDPLDLHLSTLGGLHVIEAEERKAGDVMQTTIRGHWERPGVFLCVTGERLIVAEDGKAKWGRDDGLVVRAYKWGLPE